MTAPIPKGYKRTDVGVIPEEWEVITIEQIATVKTGPFGSALHEKDYVENGTPIITVEHLGEYGISYENLPMVSDFDRQRLSSYELQEGDVVFSRVGSIDRNAYITKKESGWLFSGRLLRVRTQKDLVYPRYLSYHFHSLPFKKRVQSVAVGQTMPSLNTQILKNITVVLPPLPEQQEIAAALGDVDSLLAALDRLIAKKRAVKSAVLRDLLTGRVRLPGFEGEWERKKLLEVVGKIVKGDTITFKQVRPGDIPVIAGGTTIAYFHDTPNRTGKTITISASGANAGHVAFYSQPIFASDCSTISEDSNYSIEYVYYYLVFSQPKIKDMQVGGAQPHVYPDDLEELIIALPLSIPEQTAIAAALSDLDAELAALERERAKWQAVKQGMMDALLTGRVRLV